MDGWMDLIGLTFFHLLHGNHETGVHGLKEEIWRSLILFSEKAMAPHSCLENPMDGGAWQAAVHGVAKSRTEATQQLSKLVAHQLQRTIMEQEARKGVSVSQISQIWKQTLKMLYGGKTERIFTFIRELQHVRMEQFPIVALLASLSLERKCIQRLSGRAQWLRIQEPFLWGIFHFMSDTSLGQEQKFTFSVSMQEEHRHVSLTPGLWDFSY